MPVALLLKLNSSFLLNILIGAHVLRFLLDSSNYKLLAVSLLDCTVKIFFADSLKVSHHHYQW